jgi:cephalosporin hydroxylase
VNPIDEFKEEVKQNIESIKQNDELKEIATEFIVKSGEYKYSYNFSWMGRPIIQFPQDIVAMQEIIWNVRPDIIVETGIAHGGSLIFYASILELIGKGEVLGIDIDIRKHNRIEIEKHPMYKRINMIEGSSTDLEIAKQVYQYCKEKKRIMVILDSNHTHEHVLQELNLYSGLVTNESNLVVMDTVVEHMPDACFPNRPWGKGDNPMTAVREFLQNTDRFVVDNTIDSKLLITVAPNGFLKCVK